MTQRLLVLISLVTVCSAPAKDGGSVQTGSVSVSEQTNAATGLWFISRSTITNLFNEHGNLTQSITLSYSSGDVIPDFTSTNHLFYDRRGNLLRWVREFDFNGDGILDEVITNRLFYNRHGSLLYTIQDSDSDADGIVDGRSTTIYTNFSGNPRQVLELVDDNADGTIDQIITRIYTYDSEDRLTSVVSLFDTNADGVADFHSFSSWTYELQDHQLFYTNENDFYSPGLLEVRSTETSTLNDDAKPISSILTSYDPNTGSQLTGFLTYTYDKFGNLVQQTERATLPGPNGPSNVTTVQTFFYAHRGPRSRGTQQAGSETEGARRKMQD